MKHIASLLLLFCHAALAGDLVHLALAKADIDRLPFAIPGKVILGEKVKDALGEHMLLMTEKRIPSPNGRIERIELLAVYYDLSEDRWAANWTSKDGVDCPELDGTAAFFPGATSITDLDGNGEAEVTIAYKTFCGGGVDPATVKVILRQGKKKFAIRGESLIKFKGQAPMGGANKPDRTLQGSGNAAFKRHMEKVWQQVYVERNDG